MKGDWIFSFVSRLNSPIKWAKWIFSCFSEAILWYYDNSKIIPLLKAEVTCKTNQAPVTLSACILRERSSRRHVADSVSVIATHTLILHLPLSQFHRVFFQKIVLSICIFRFIGIVRNIYLLFFSRLYYVLSNQTVVYFALISFLLILLARCLPI